MACSSDVIEGDETPTKDAAAESEGPVVCIPGESKACAGPGACAGFQVCSADGRRLEACDCTGSGAGGSGAATGGAGGTRDAGPDVGTGGTMVPGGSTGASGFAGMTGSGGTIGSGGDAGEPGSGGLAGAAGQAGASSSCGQSGFEIATGQASPHGIFTDFSNVYWANQGDGRIIKSAIGQNLPTVHQSGLSRPFAIASAKVWTELGPSDAQGSVALSLGGTLGITRVGDQNRPESVVQLSNGYAWGTLGDGTVRFCAGTAVPCESPTTLAQGQDPVELAGRSGATAGDPVTVYWVNRSLGTVVSCPTSGCSGTPAEITSGQDQPHSLALDQYAVYFATSTAILKCALTGCADAPTPVITDQRPFDIAVTSRSVYWTDRQHGEVRSTAVTGGANWAQTIACGLTGPNQITLGNSNVFWTNDDGRVLWQYAY